VIFAAAAARSVNYKIIIIVIIINFIWLKPNTNAKAV